MKNLNFAASIMAGLFIALGQNAHAEIPNQYGNAIEIPIDGFIAPAVGFEDKNNVEGVVYGYLPNSCYSLGKPKITVSTEGEKKISIEQLAVKRTDGICGEGSDLAPHLNMKIPFSSEVFIGIIPAGSYKVEYRTPEGLGVRTLEVARSKIANGDNFPYANVMNAMTPEVIHAGEDIQLVLSGIYNSSCTTLDHVDQERVNDVLIILPILKTKPGNLCAEVLIPFHSSINLGKVDPGIHLIHVRSMNGKAVNRLVNVVQ